MAANSANDYAPYFRNGLLYLPAKTVDLLTQAGLDHSIGEAALHGLALDDNREQIARISKALEQLLGQIEDDTDEFRVLSSGETRFLLTGKPPASV